MYHTNPKRKRGNDRYFPRLRFGFVFRSVFQTAPGFMIRPGQSEPRAFRDNLEA
jgi:hypothetical protein